MGFRLTSFGKVKKKPVKRKRKKVVKRKRKKVVKRKPKKVVKRKKRMYKYRKKKFIPKGIRNSGEWQEFQKQMSGQGYSQREVAEFYREYLASKPSRFTQMVRSGNISGLTKEGGRIGKNFLYDEIKRNARIQGRRELNNLVRSGGGVLGILSRGGSRQDVARHLNRINRTKKNSKLVQSAIDSLADYRNPPRNNPFI